jgi:hypothetical protein
MRGDELTPGAFAPTLTEVVSQFGRGTALGQTRTVLEGTQSVLDITQANQNITGFIESNLPSPQEIQNAVSGIRGNE